MKPVWIVDDDRSIRWVIEKALSREGIAYNSFSPRRKRSTRSPARCPRCSSPTSACRGARARASAGGEAAPSRGARHRDDGVLRPRQRGRGVPGRRLRVPAQASTSTRRSTSSGARSRREGARPGNEPLPETEILGQAPAMQEVFRAIGRLSQSSATVLITGESGTGKELVARALHRHSARAQAAVHRDQHRRDAEGPARVRALRPRARLVHRSAAAAPRPLRAGRRRDAFPRRDRRHACRAADAASARAFRRHVLPRRRPPADQGQRARDRGHAPEPRAARARRNVPRGPLPPPQRHPPAAAEPARARRGHPAIGQAIPRAQRAAARRRAQAHRRRRARAHLAARLSGQRAPAREPLPLAYRDGAGAGDRPRQPAARVPRPAPATPRPAPATGSRRSSRKPSAASRAATPASSTSSAVSSSARSSPRPSRAPAAAASTPRICWAWAEIRLPGKSRNSASRTKIGVRARFPRAER